MSEIPTTTPENAIIYQLSVLSLRRRKPHIENNKKELAFGWKRERGREGMKEGGREKEQEEEI